MTTTVCILGYDVQLNISTAHLHTTTLTRCSVDRTYRNDFKTSSPYTCVLPYAIPASGFFTSSTSVKQRRGLRHIFI
jgi:hypothetical protein